MSIDDQRRVTFVDDISPITADILNDLQAVTFDTFSNLKLKVDGDVLRLHTYDGGNPDYSGYIGSPSALVVNGKIRFPDGSSDAMKAGIDPEPSVNPDDYHNVYVDIGQDTGVYINSNLHEVAFERVAGNNRRGVARYNTVNGKFANTEMLAGAVARSRQYNAFTFESIDGNSTPLTINGINEDKPNLVVDAEVTFKPHDDPEYAADGHIMVDTAKGGIKTELIVAPDSTDPLAPSDPTVVIGHNVHIPGDITVDGDLIFDTHELGTIGASRWDDLLNADETLPWELSDCTFEHLLPNASHAPINYYPLGTIIELATGSDFDDRDVTTWPTGWLLMDDSIRWDMTDDNTVYWLTPLIEYLDGVGSVPADEWSVPGGTTPGGAYKHFIFLGPMSYLTMDSTTGKITVDTEAQERGREWTAIKWL